MRSGPLRRIRGYWGHFALVAAVTVVAAGLATAAPRVANHLTDEGLRHDVAALPEEARDVAFTSTPQAFVNPTSPGLGRALLDRYQARFGPPLGGLIEESWYSAHLGPDGVTARGPRAPFNWLAAPKVGLRTQTGVTEAARLTAGGWPATDPNADPGVVEAAVSAPVARALGLRVDSEFDFAHEQRFSTTIVVRIVGIFEPIDPEAAIWSGMGLALAPHVPMSDADPYRAIALTDDEGIVAADRVAGPTTNTWRYRVDEGRLDAAQLDPSVTALAAARNNPPEGGVAFVTSLDRTLLRLGQRIVAARALVAVVQFGILATLLGLLVLAARLAVERRRQEFALLRARGGATWTIGGGALTESLMVFPAAATAGWAAGTMAPGRAASTGWLVVLVGAVAVLAVPLLAAASQRRVTFAGIRRDLVRHKPSVRRLTAEISVLVLGGLGVLLLRRRGLDQHGGVDPFLVSVPVLLAIGTAMLALRLFPWSLRAAGRLATRSRGAVAFLGLSRAGRTAPAVIWPLAVLVVAITTGVFCASVNTTINDARDRVTDAEIAADAVLTGYAFSPETPRRLAAVPGVTGVAAAAVHADTPVRPPPGRDITERAPVVVAIVDAPTWASVLERSGLDHAFPPDWLAATAGEGAVPAVVSPAVAEDVSAGGITEVQGQQYAFRTAGVMAQFPGLDRDLTRFVVLPWQALPSGATPLPPNRILVAGSRADPAALRAAGDAGQREWLSEVLQRDVDRLPLPTRVTTWRDHRAGLERTGANEVLTATFAGGAAGATVLALLAVGFAVVADARTRGRALSRLRTMGLSPRQGRGLLMYELAPLVGTAVLAGGVVGLALPGLFAPALGLSTFTAGVAVRLRIDPMVVGGMLALVVAALAAAILVEGMVNRRLRLGEVLRVGEEG
jgi:putative ABC transport system permease protein